LWSWGYNTVGQVGFGQLGQPHTPAILKRNIKDMICGFHHSLALDDDNRLWAWGGNSYGQLGLGDTTNREEPTLVEGLPSDLAPYHLRKYRRGVNIKSANSDH
jgi:alpha-tubulin suppressor-like RCC1 family protein